MTDQNQTQAPTVTQLVTAFANALLPLAGPWGVVATDVVAAGEQFLEQFKNSGKTVYSMADLEQLASQTTSDLNVLQQLDQSQQATQAQAATQKAAILAADAAAAKPVGLPADKMTPVVGAGNASTT